VPQVSHGSSKETQLECKVLEGNLTTKEGGYLKAFIEVNKEAVVYNRFGM
jgi:hypothetical protein